MASYGYTFNSGDGVTPTRLNAARTVSDIVNADIKSDAAILGTKIAPDFGSQNLTTTGFVTTGAASREVGGNTAQLQSHGTIGARLAATRWTADTNGPVLTLFKSRGAAVGTRGAVQSGDTITSMEFYGDDGTNDVLAARILAQVDGTPGTNDMPGRLVFSTTADGASSVTERMRIDSDGYVNVGSATIISPSTTTNAGVSLSPLGINASRSANPAVNLQRSTNNGSVVQFWRDNTLVGSISVTTTATAYNTSSDYRLKENATPLTGGLATIDQLQPCQFTWKSDGSIGRGFIAHELQAVVPEAVTGEKDAVDAEGNPQYQGVDASKLVPLLVAAVQELSAKVAALEAAQ